jgi:hydroxymethylbilane synthase
MVAERLRARWPEASVEIAVIKTTGDARQDIPLPAMAGKGVFVREIEAALQRGEIDLAVHSAKDLQSTDPDGLTLAAFCERADPRDALVSPAHGKLDALPQGATVATGSPRRVAQLKHRRPDLRFVEIRGNVDTRLRKLADGEADALVLAVAGLTRLGREDAITERLSVEACLPQVGQACVAVQCRVADPDTVAAVAAACDDAPTRVAVTAERAFLARLGGGCTAPVAAYARPAGGTDGSFLLEALVAAPDGSQVFRAAQTFAGEEGDRAADELYRELLRQGAGTVLAQEPQTS